MEPLEMSLIVTTLFELASLLKRHLDPGPDPTDAEIRGKLSAARSAMDEWFERHPEDAPDEAP